MSGLYTIAAGADFAQTLAKGLIARIKPAELSRSIIFLPTRRAARSFGEAFAKELGGSALLPQFRALGDSEEEDGFDSSAEGIELAPAIAPIRRQLLLAKLIQHWDEKSRSGTLTFAQASHLADSLAGLMDEMERHGVDLGQLKELAPPQLAAHWQEVTFFLDLIADHWPAILAEENAVNPQVRQNQALALLTERITRSPPEGMVIAAGSTGSIPATQRLLAAIAALPNGAVVLPGLDRNLDEASWQEMDEGHPQFGMKQLLAALEVARAGVADWDGDNGNSQREALLRETLRPAPTTDAWRALAENGSDEIARGLEGLSLIEANDAAEEALVIALALRHTLETPGRTAALVTPDRNLARRVAAELTRWDITIDDSAGRPLAHTSAGAFLALVAETAEASFAPVKLLALLKHPFSTLGEEPAPFRAQARLLDKYALRGLRPDPGLDGVAKAIAAARAEKRNPTEALEQLAAWWDNISAILSPLEQAFAQKQLALADLIQAHLAVAEKLACKARKDCPLWRGPDGTAAAELFANFAEAAQDLPPIDPRFYPALLRTLAMKVPVRPAFVRSRAIAILGPLEARLQRFDLTILGGLNEGTWPQSPPADPWFSRPMRKALGLDQPERRIGLAAHDFATLAAWPQVLLTRARKSEGTPAIASRWLQRLTQLAHGLELEARLAPSTDYIALARTLSETPRARPLPRPAPTPDVSARPKRLSVTEIETWLRDPYAIYAKHILRLKPLDELEEEVGPLERGTALHRALEIFMKDFPEALPDDAVAQLTARADLVFAELGVPHAALAIWRPRFQSAAEWFVDFERERRALVSKSHLEIRGSRKFGDFELTGIADRIDILKSGGAAILDYKTGRPPSPKQMEQLLTPQLPLEAAMLADGGFPGLGKLIAQELLYIRLSGGPDGNDDQQVKEPVSLAQKAVERLDFLLALFADKNTPYLSRVRPFSAKGEGDYDHLARVREWAPSGWSEES